MMASEVKGRIFEVGPGVSGSEAEATVTGQGGKDVFVSVSHFEGRYNFGVYNRSVYGDENVDYASDKACIIEQYEELPLKKDSAYYKVFKVLKSVVDMLESGI